MLTFLFWNLNKKRLADQLARLARQHVPDVIALAESGIDPADALTVLNGTTDARYTFPTSDGTKIQLYVRPSVGSVVEQFIDPPGSVTVRRLDLPIGESILLAAIHLPSRMNWSSGSQALHSVVIAQEIRNVEGDVGHQRTIVVGDLNQNPYDLGIVGAHAFNAAMTRRLTRIGQRSVQGRKYPFFYNPMRGVFGDRTHGPPGTFFHAAMPPDSTIWNIYDQVLLRPSLMNKLLSLQVLDSDGLAPLVNRGGRPLRSRGSDHLPLLFTIDI